MAHTAPTLEQFKARYSEFASISDPILQAVLDDAISQVSTLWSEADYPRAIMLLTAHMLLVEGRLDQASGRQSTMTTRGSIKTKKVGDVSVTYEGAGGASSGGGSVYPGTYGTSEYGRRYYDLLRLNFPAVLAV